MAVNVWFILADQNGICRICKIAADKHDPEEKAWCYAQFCLAGKKLED